MEKLFSACCLECNHEWRCKEDEVETMHCPGCGDKPSPIKAKTLQPVFTKAMQDAGELPSVGMECCYSSSSMVIWNKCTIIAYYDGFVWTSDNGIRPLANTRFKPITPPIEPIDGKRYEFELSFGDLWVGYYSSVRNSFFSDVLYSNKLCGKSQATDIKLLEVKS